MTITEVLQQWNSGDREALNRLLPIVSQRLRELADHHLQNESSAAFQPTELLHEVYLRLTQSTNPNFRDRHHFFGVASSLIRRILVDCARRNRAAKRGFTLLVHVPQEELAAKQQSVDLEMLDASLEKLAALDPRQVRIVELRYFSGLSISETAQFLGISPATVKRDWSVAKAWLKRELEK